MKNQNGRLILYIILGVIAIGIVYTACKDITPAQKRVETKVELKLGK